MTKAKLSKKLCVILSFLLALPHLALADARPSLTPELLNSFSSANLSKGGNLRSLEVITDNKRALESKIDIVNKASNTLDLVYYIFSTDRSSSRLAEALVNAAGRGVRVRLLVDLHTNYNNLDHFEMLEGQARLKAQQKGSGGSLVVRFYNRPSRNIVLDATYMTTDCGDAFNATNSRTACSDVKYQNIDRLYYEAGVTGASDDTYGFYNSVPEIKTEGAKLYLSGLYSKDGDILRKSIIEGQKIDIDAVSKALEAPQSTDAGKEQARAAKEKIESLKAFGQLVWENKTTSSLITWVITSIQLWFAYKVYGSELNPLMNKVNGMFPNDVDGSRAYEVRKDRLNQDRGHLTDFTHHKLLLADGKLIQLGGRNVEDSYHTNNSDLVHKYIFMDVDSRIELNNQNSDMKNSYERLFDHLSLTVGIPWLRRNIPNDLVASMNIAKADCKEEKLADLKRASLTRAENKLVSDRVDDRKEYNARCMTDESVDPSDESNLKPVLNKYVASCYPKKLASGLKPLHKRLGLAYSAWKKNLRLYKQTQEKGQDPLGSRNMVMSASDKAKANVTYIENIPFTQSEPALRRYGSVQNQEAASGKYMHEIMIRAMKAVCQGKSQSKRIVFHNAYFAPPANIVDAFAQMIDGTWNCRGVSIQVLTNSFATTDLSPVNAISRHTMLAFTEYVEKFRSASKGASFQLLEYKTPGGVASDKSRSLHAKVSVIGDDLLVGSANLDVRSFYMDTNNGVYIQNATDLSGQYLAHFDRITSPRADLVKDETQWYVGKSHGEVIAEDQKIFDCSILKYSSKDRLAVPSYLAVKQKILGIAQNAYNLTSQYVGSWDPNAENAACGHQSLGAIEVNGQYYCGRVKTDKTEARRKYDERLKVF